MKLSEAIRLGAMMGPQVFGLPTDGRGTCAGAAALLANGMTIQEMQSWGVYQHSVFKLVKAQMCSLPTRVCPSCNEKCAGGGGVIVHLNNDHRWTREQIADWVQTIEPAEVHASETIREVQYGQVPKRSTPEVETFETITI